MEENISSLGNFAIGTTGIFKDELAPQIRIPGTFPTPPKCQVCGDTGAGVHYGAVTCHGCRAFFRRCANSKLKYLCHFHGRCIINTSARLKCKACRYKKCLHVGMKNTDYLNQDHMGDHDSINNEDQQVKRSKLESPPYLDKDPLPKFPCTQILWNLQQIQDQVSTKFAPHFPKIGIRYSTGPQDVAEGITVELHYLVDWVKKIDLFQGLDTPSQITLLKARCTQLIFLETARRWMDLEADDYFVGANGIIVPKHSGPMKKGVANIKVFTEFLEPCRELKVTEEESLCLKALIMFNPNTHELREEDRWKVGDYQRQIKLLMESNYNTANWKEDRLFNLLMLLPSLCAVAEKLNEVMRNRSIMGDIRPFRIMKELLLDT